MNVSINWPSSMDAKVADKGSAAEELIVVTPRRYSKSQRKINLFPFLVTQENGDVSGRGYISLDLRTGTLVIENRLTEVPVNVEPPKPRKPREAKDKK